MSKNYVTIAIPEVTRDEAQDDPRTYEEIMQAGLSGENTMEPLPDEITGDAEFEPVVDEPAIVEQLENKIDSLAYDGVLTDEEAEDIMSSLKTIEERTGRLERQMEDLR